MKRELKIILFVSISVVFLLVTIGFTSVKNGSKMVRNVLVEIEDQNGNYFTDRLEILNMLNGENADYILSLSIDELDLKILEERVETNAFVKEAQIYKDILGNLVIRVKQAQPIARIINRKGPDQYIDTDGELLPTSVRYTARVPIIEMERGFSWEENITELEYGLKVLELLKYIENDEFWKAQIAQVNIAADGELKLLPQVTKQEIYFGMPDELEEKFKKLKVFYKEILPNKGWNTYRVVNLKFKNQIVCE